MPESFRRLTPGEFYALARAKMGEAKRIRAERDALNAKQCEVIARCAGNENVTPGDFLIWMEVKEVKTDTPEKLAKDLMRLSGGDHDGK